MSNAPSKPVSFSRPKVGYFSNRPRIVEHALPYVTIKNWVAQFKRGDFSTWCALSWTTQNSDTSEIIDQIHELILEDRRISYKSITEQLSISRERVESIIHEDLDMRKLSA